MYIQLIVCKDVRDIYVHFITHNIACTYARLYMYMYMESERERERERERVIEVIPDSPW